MNDLEILRQIEKQLNLSFVNTDINANAQYSTDTNGNVVRLSIQNITVTDLTLVGKLENLIALALVNTQLKEIKPLSNLKNIILLDLDNNLIKDISPIKTLFKNDVIVFDAKNNPLKYPQKKL